MNDDKLDQLIELARSMESRMNRILGDRENKDAGHKRKAFEYNAENIITAISYFMDEIFNARLLEKKLSLYRSDFAQKALMSNEMAARALIAELRKKTPQDQFAGPRCVFVLHGYWNTPEEDGAAILGFSDDVDILERKLQEIAENKGIPGLFQMTGVRLEEFRDKRTYEVSNIKDFGYAKFFVESIGTELLGPAIGSEEFAIFCQNADGIEERIARGFESELLCRNRFKEALEHKWFSFAYDMDSAVIKKRNVVSIAGEWEVVGNAGS